ncbi:carboxylesterase family protein [Flectobacillus sp. DC10W]|uniref:Carboxylic ester hydrolase n=1 Tax=Flectobacillus longus TaxID=2984207 RepID=A0ABT6YKZ7_9BACT|nr:carboxylesterase family protein [Flectobacillus longus]MDI9864263.1 carboxylesterase family protein [Flectobacillus longus]
MKKIFLGLLLFSTFSLKAQTDVPKVHTLNGIVRGTTDGESAVFKGIPFAAPPVGEFRWRPPQPVKNWEGELDATKPCKDCAQAGFGPNAPKMNPNSSEDCLFLNVWKPTSATKTSKLPVMVWIYGGGFVAGSASSPQNYGHSLNKNGVILVNINYRLGRMGFFAHPALSKEFPNEAKGNFAYMDQIAALQWVQKNIAEFGGDPNNVTIFGFSAGGVSVHSLLTIPAAKGLFHKVISHSGGGRDGVLTGRPINKEDADIFYKVSAETIGVNFAQSKGIEGNDATALAKLRAMPADSIIDGGRETSGANGAKIYSGPIFDGKLVTQTAETAYLVGKQPKMPMMIGNCSAEIGGAFVSNAKTKEELFASFGDLATEAKSAYDSDGSKKFEEVIAKFNSDWVWGEPASMAARATLAKGSPAYVFQFGYVPAAAQQRSPYGAGHGSDISFAFNTLNARWGSTAEPTDTEKELAKVMCAYWANFAKTGNPNGEGLPKWPLYSNQNQDMLDIELDGKIIAKPDPRKARLDVVEKAVKYRGKIQTRGI